MFLSIYLSIHPCNYVYIHMKVSWNRATAKSSTFDWDFPLITIHFWGTPMTMETPISKLWDDNYQPSIDNYISNQVDYIYIYLSGWWLGHPSEKYEFVNWDEDTPNIWEKNGNQTTNQYSYLSISTSICPSIYFSIFLSIIFLPSISNQLYIYIHISYPIAISTEIVDHLPALRPHLVAPWWGSLDPWVLASGDCRTCRLSNILEKWWENQWKMGKSWENHGKINGRWENHGKIMGKSLENHGKMSEKWWENHGHMGELCNMMSSDWSYPPCFLGDLELVTALPFRIVVVGE